MSLNNKTGRPLTNDEVLEKLAAAVSSRDTEAALKYYHREMIMDIPAFGRIYKGEHEMRVFLNKFFATFPDYEILLDRSWEKEGHMLVLGKLCMTLTGEFGGYKANGKRAIVPVFMDLTFRDECTDYELFLFDIASICRVADVPTDAFVASMVA